jgi:hypothetical protein
LIHLAIPIVVYTREALPLLIAETLCCRPALHQQVAERELDRFMFFITFEYYFPTFGKKRNIIFLDIQVNFGVGIFQLRS